jgi:Ca2+-transporting ATPase
MPILDLSSITGLSSEEAGKRLGAQGHNELPTASQRGLIRIIIEVIHEPMFLLLVVCGVVYLLIGSIDDALMLLGFVFIIMGITIYQERKTERALESLRDLTSPRALVIREGRQKRIAGREVVKDDIIVIFYKFLESVYGILKE